MVLAELKTKASEDSTPGAPFRRRTASPRNRAKANSATPPTTSTTPPATPASSRPPPARNKLVRKPPEAHQPVTHHRPRRRHRTGETPHRQQLGQSSGHQGQQEQGEKADDRRPARMTPSPWNIPATIISSKPQAAPSKATAAPSCLSAASRKSSTSHTGCGQPRHRSTRRPPAPTSATGRPPRARHHSGQRPRQLATQPCGSLRIRLTEDRRHQHMQRADGGQTDEAQGVQMQVRRRRAG